MNTTPVRATRKGHDFADNELVFFYGTNKAPECEGRAAYFVGRFMFDAHTGIQIPVITNATKFWALRA